MVSPVSVIIPTHNRPDMLREAIASVCAQTHSLWELTIVDDGSTPAVSESELRNDFSPNIRVIRNDKPVKLNTGRDQGVQAASHDLVIQLDDDDMLAPGALEEAVSTLNKHPELELIFLNVKGFGERASHFDSAQGQALSKILQHSNADTTAQANLTLFPQAVFTSLLNSVPMAFQRALVRRNAWNKVCDLRRSVYMLDPAISTKELANERISPPLRDSEWALYAAAACNIALLNTPVYLQRCEGQGAVSRPEKKGLAIKSSIDIKRHLLKAAQNMDEFSGWQDEIKTNLAKALFEEAYHNFYSGLRFEAYVSLFSSLSVNFSASYLRFAFRMLLPAGKHSDM